MKLLIKGREFYCWSKVRNELNGLRPRPNDKDICYQTKANASQGVAIMPRAFKPCKGKIEYFVNHEKDEKGSYLYPVFIGLGVVHKVPEYSLDENGFYAEPTGNIVDDYGIGAHFSGCKYTQGCLHLNSEEDARWIWENCPVGTDWEVIDD